MSKPTKSPALVSLSFDEWESKFKPLTNLQDPNASFGGLMFETYGQELAGVLLYANGHTGKAGCRKVWTLVEGDEGESLIVEGYHLCNRLGYFITAKPAKAGQQYEVSL